MLIDEHIEISLSESEIGILEGIEVGQVMETRGEELNLDERRGGYESRREEPK